MSESKPADTEKEKDTEMDTNMAKEKDQKPNSFKLIYNTLRPGTWIKSTLMIALAIFISRFSIGIGWFRANLIFGSISIFLFSMACMLTLLVIQSRRDEGINIKKMQLLKIVALILYAATLGLNLYQIIVWNVGIFSLIFLVAVVGIGLFLLFKPPQKEGFTVFHPIAVAILPFIAILYGGMLNFPFPPFYLWIIALGIFALQFAKELNKKAPLNSSKPYQDVHLLVDHLGSKKFFQFILGFEFVGSLLLGLPIFLPIPNSFLYLWGWLLVLLFTGLSLTFTYRMDEKLKNVKKVNAFLKLSLFFSYFMVFLGSV